MKYLLFFSLLFTGYVQAQKKNIAYVLYPILTTPPAIQPNGDTTINVYLSQPYRDSLKTAFTTNNTQAGQITGISNQVATDGVNIAKNTADITALQNSTGAGIPVPVLSNTSYTLKLTDHGKTIWMNCTCTVFTPVLTPGFKVWIQSGTGTVTIKPTGLVTYQEQSDLSITKNQRPILIDYKTTSNVNVR